MQKIVEKIKNAFLEFCTQDILEINKIPESGSDRIYFRIITKEKSYIGLYSQNISENKTFIYFTNHFKSKDLAVPNIYYVNVDNSIYIQEDLGNQSLLEILENQGQTDFVFELFKKSLQKLAKIQILGHQNLDYKKCLTNQEFGKQAILSDLLYFKYYFLDTLKYPYNKQELLDDFEILGNYLGQSQFNFFLFRDFQSRNIIIKNNEPYFIDYQGGMRGSLLYDVASLLWQAKANLDFQWQEKLLNYYIQEVEVLLEQKLNKEEFTNQFNGFVLIRLLQVLGAYGFRGLFERKAHFLSSIPFALNNLKKYLNHALIQMNTPILYKILEHITSEEITHKFTIKKATDKTLLKIEINSFSYRNGVPIDESENGGGFIFDMRGIFNPGRFDEYKKLSGLDKSVHTFLEQNTRVLEFLNSVWDLIDISIENYMERNFKNLIINFGCTGGQHRSVFAAEETARHIRNKYNLQVKINHLNQLNWVK